jgi:hypothetical protein
MTSQDDMPMPSKGVCCEHAAACAIHLGPHDAKYVQCTCKIGAGRPRHSWRVAGLSLIQGSTEDVV